MHQCQCFYAVIVRHMPMYGQVSRIPKQTKSRIEENKGSRKACLGKYNTTKYGNVSHRYGLVLHLPLCCSELPFDSISQRLECVLLSQSQTGS